MKIEDNINSNISPVGHEGVGQRQYYIDWLRIIAIGLLLIYHSAICFQPWGGFFGFITNWEPWQALWMPMTMINIWRIPLLFYLSGMGLYLAIQNKNWKQLFTERFLRLGVPLIFGSLFIVPIHCYLLQYYYHRDITYLPSMGHLWFLGNILIYSVIIAPIFYLSKYKIGGNAINFPSKIISKPLFLVFIIVTFVIETLSIKPQIFEMYAFTFHGLILGFLAFSFGYLFMAGATPFWQMFVKYRWIYFGISTVLFILRYLEISSQATTYLLSIESNLWIFAALSFAYKYLNFNNIALKYLREAAYPVYILHMVFLFSACTLIVPVKMYPPLKYALLLLFTFLGSLAFYELIVKRFNVKRVLFGLKKK